MSKRLASYLHDHLAGARLAIDLLKRLRDQCTAEPLGQLAGQLLVEVEEDRQTLQEIAQRVGEDASTLKDASSWLMEKFVPMKLRLGTDAEFSRYLVVEALCLGVQGKQSLWRALAQITPTDARLSGVDWDRLIARAQSQHERLESYRLQAATSVFP